MQKIATCLWFDGQAEEAMNFYAKRTERVMQAMMKMIKLDINALQQAYEQR